VSTVALAVALGRAWAVSDGNAGASYTSFDADLDAIDALDWPAIRARDWRGRIHEKSAEFLVADFFPWTRIQTVGCHNSDIAHRVQDLLRAQNHAPKVRVERNWYYLDKP
jgi:ssDNA thymidine ADP-ribosyltransferase DarT-like protein